MTQCKHLSFGNNVPFCALLEAKGYKAPKDYELMVDRYCRPGECKTFEAVMT